MRYRFVTADVFTERLFGGNPLAVFPDATGLDTPVMQAVAQEFNLSETVFVFPPIHSGHARRLRIFTPDAELPFAGHPTVGAALMLALRGALPLSGDQTKLVFEEGVGPVPVIIRAHQGRPVFAQLTAPKLPEFGPSPPHPEQVAAMLSLEPEDLDGEIRGASCGVPFLFVPVAGLSAVRRARLNSAIWESLSPSLWSQELFIYAREAVEPGSHIHARMFAPALGISEDPATGAAAAALAGVLGERDPTNNGPLRWVVEQGFEMGRPSILEVEADKQNGAIVAVRVGGAAVLVSEGEMEIPASGT